MNPFWHVLWHFCAILQFCNIGIQKWSLEGGEYCSFQKFTIFCPKIIKIDLFLHFLQKKFGEPRKFIVPLHSRSARRSHGLNLTRAPGSFKRLPLSMVETTLSAVSSVRSHKPSGFSMLSPYGTAKAWFLVGAPRFQKPRNFRWAGV